MAKSNLQSNLLLDFEIIKESLLKIHDVDAFPKEYFLEKILSILHKNKITSFTAMDIRNIFVVCKKQGLAYESCSEKICIKYLSKHLGVKPYRLGVQGGVYGFNDGKYLQDKINKEASKSCKASKKSEFHITSINAWIEQNKEAIDRHQTTQLFSEIVKDNWCEIRYELNNEKGAKNREFSSTELLRMVKAMVENFGVEYKFFLCEHATEQADGESYVKDGRELSMMVNGIGEYIWAGTITLSPQVNNVFQRFIERTVELCFLSSSDSIVKYSSYVRIENDAIVVRVGTTEPVIKDEGYSRYSCSMLNTHLQEIFAYGTGELPCCSFTHA